MQWDKSSREWKTKRIVGSVRRYSKYSKCSRLFFPFTPIVWRVYRQLVRRVTATLHKAYTAASPSKTPSVSQDTKTRKNLTSVRFSGWTDSVRVQNQKHADCSQVPSLKFPARFNRCSAA